LSRFVIGYHLGGCCSRLRRGLDWSTRRTFRSCPSSTSAADPKVKEKKGKQLKAAQKPETWLAEEEPKKNIAPNNDWIIPAPGAPSNVVYFWIPFASSFSVSAVNAFRLITLKIDK